MTGINFGTSLVKRESKSTDQVLAELKTRGWKETDSIGNRLFYLENSGLGISVLDGIMGTVIFPSGPIRGRLFGNTGAELSQESLIEPTFENERVIDVRDTQQQTTRNKTNNQGGTPSTNNTNGGNNGDSNNTTDNNKETQSENNTGNGEFV